MEHFTSFKKPRQVISIQSHSKLWKSRMVSIKKKELSNNTRNFERILVYENGGIKHAVHVDKLSKSNRVICENSFGPQDPDVRIVLDDVLKLYRVHCSAEKVLLPERGPTTAAKISTTTPTQTAKVYDELMMISAGQMPGNS